jgi:hypothetical protein
MEFLKKFLSNDTTVVGLCDLKRRQTFNSFNYSNQYNFTQPFNQAPERILATNIKF